jgi:hypothetical protein
MSVEVNWNTSGVMVLGKMNKPNVGDPGGLNRHNLHMRQA